MVGSTHASAVEEIKVPTLSPGGLRSIRARAVECLLAGALHTTYTANANTPLAPCLQLHESAAIFGVLHKRRYS